MRKAIKISTVLLIVNMSISPLTLAEPNSYDSDDVAEAEAFNRAKISLIEAIQIAEQKAGARAISAEFEKEHDTYLYAVEFLKPDGSEIEIEINAHTGKVIKVEKE